MGKYTPKIQIQMSTLLNTHLKYKYNFQKDTNTTFILGEIIGVVGQIRRVQK